MEVCSDAGGSCPWELSAAVNKPKSSKTLRIPLGWSRKVERKEKGNLDLLKWRSEGERPCIQIPRQFSKKVARNPSCPQCSAGPGRSSWLRQEGGSAGRAQGQGHRKYFKGCCDLARTLYSVFLPSQELSQSWVWL